MATFNMSRSASFYESGIGRGDDSTDLGFVHHPRRARERILTWLPQLPSGGAYHSTSR
jgi:cellobiose phosphorylase